MVSACLSSRRKASLLQKPLRQVRCLSWSTILGEHTSDRKKVKWSVDPRNELPRWLGSRIPSLLVDSRPWTRWEASPRHLMQQNRVILQLLDVSLGRKCGSSPIPAQETGSSCYICFHKVTRPYSRFLEDDHLTSWSSLEEFYEHPKTERGFSWIAGVRVVPFPQWHAICLTTCATDRGTDSTPALHISAYCYRDVMGLLWLAFCQLSIYRTPFPPLPPCWLTLYICSCAFWQRRTFC